MTRQRPEDAPVCQGCWCDDRDEDDNKLRDVWRCSACDAESPEECYLDNPDTDDDAHNDPRSGQAAGINRHK